ncbi:hypothetical protein NW757_014492 [Fusarium falciforme]|nr:hypothetical protein NW757_014492 [Fusarium falciforme]
MPTSKELKAIRRIGQKSYLRAQQIISQSTSAMPDPARSGRRASTSSSQTSLTSSNATEDEMEIEVDTQHLAQQASNTQPASSQRRGRRQPRKDYNIANAFSTLDDNDEDA